ncbi:MAG: hypothetical protein FWD70_07705, partial [Desulfuromonadales bacterium]|nr:hypothetical protein [Desulfuromonadales bacterium]
MNKVFKTIWNEALCSWVPVAEITKAHGKGRGGKLVVAAIMAAALWVTFSSAAYAATGDSSTGAFVDSGDSGSASLGTYNGVTSSGGILSAKSGGNLTVTTPDMNVTNTGDGNAIGIYASGTDASGTGSTITLNNATVSTTAGANSWMSMDDALRAESGGVITATGTLNLSTAGSQAAGIRASGAGSIVNAGDIIYTGTGNASTGLWATGGGAINTGNVNISINSTGGSYGYGLLAEANSTISITGGTINENDTTSTSNSAVRAIGVNSIINVTGPLIINTKNSLSLTNPSQGAARGVYASGGGTVNLSDITITTTGTISNGFEVGKVVNAAGEGAGGINVDGNINVAVSGLNAVALAVQAPAGAG